MDHERAVGETAKLGFVFGWASGSAMLGTLALTTPEPLSKAIFTLGAIGFGYIAAKSAPVPAYADNSQGATRMLNRVSEWGQGGYAPALAAGAA